MSWISLREWPTAFTTLAIIRTWLRYVYRQRRPAILHKRPTLERLHFPHEPLRDILGEIQRPRTTHGQRHRHGVDQVVGLDNFTINGCALHIDPPGRDRIEAEKPLHPDWLLQPVKTVFDVAKASMQ